MYILGISGLYHDSAAALIKDGEIVAAAQEERFTRIKHDSRLPLHAIKYCMEEEQLTINDIDAVVYYDNPLITLDRYLDNLKFLGGESDLLIEKSYENLLGNKLWIHRAIKDILGGIGKAGKLLVTQHHISHAASAFYPSPYDKAVIVTIDGVGEWTTTAIGVGNQEHLKIYEELEYPHSLGLLYSAFTYFCGFKVNSGDYKFMGLAPYGHPIYYDIIKNEMIRLNEDGSFTLNLQYFDFHKGKTMINEQKFAEIFSYGRRTPESMITQREMDIAASVQKLTEEIIIHIVKHAKEKYGQGIDNLVLAGGVALNCVANGKLYKEQIFKNIWIQPAAGDAGGALGAALYTYYMYYHNKRIVKLQDSQKGSQLGPCFSDAQIVDFLEKKKVKYHILNDLTYADEIANYLADEKVIGLFNGRMEFGPRALGNRSIIADCRSSYMQSRINLKIKYRESFRPFAPLVLADKQDEYFDLSCPSPYMLMVGNVNESKRVNFDLDNLLKENDGDMLKVVNCKRSDIPAVTHVDYSARIQTVDNQKNPYLYSIMQNYYQKTGCAVLVNTSFNVRGEPIVCTPLDAYECFMRTDMDILVMEHIILFKEEQPDYSDESWREQYELD